MAKMDFAAANDDESLYKMFLRFFESKYVPIVGLIKC